MTDDPNQPATELAEEPPAIIADGITGDVLQEFLRGQRRGKLFALVVMFFALLFTVLFVIQDHRSFLLDVLHFVAGFAFLASFFGSFLAIFRLGIAYTHEVVVERWWIQAIRILLTILMLPCHLILAVLLDVTMRAKLGVDGYGIFALLTLPLWLLWIVDMALILTLRKTGRRIPIRVIWRKEALFERTLTWMAQTPEGQIVKLPDAFFYVSKKICEK